jgi:hypothetical protein
MWGEQHGLCPFYFKKNSTRCLFCSNSDHCDARKIRVYVLLIQKLIFQPIFWQKKTPIKHLRSHERPNYDIKNPKNHLKNWTQLEFKYIFSWTFKIHKHLIWTSLSNVTIWYKYSLFWWSRSVSIKYFSLYCRNPTISLSLSPLQPGTKKYNKFFFYTKIKVKQYQGTEIV